MTVMELFVGEGVVLEALVEVEGVAQGIVPEIARVAALPPHPRDEAAAPVLHLWQLLRLGTQPHGRRSDQ